MIICPNCQAGNGDESKVCFFCDQPLKKRGLLSKIAGALGGGRNGNTSRQPQDVGVEAGYQKPAQAPTGGEARAEARTSDRTPESAQSPLPSLPSNPKEEVHALKEQSRDYINRGQYRRAIEACTQAIELDHRYTAAYYNRGLSYLKLGEYEKAADDFGEAIRLDSKDPEAYINRGLSFLMMWQPERALQDYDEAVRLDPDNAGHYVGRGAAYFDLEDFERSIVEFDQAIRLDPQLANAYNNRAWSYIRLGKLAEAEEDAKQTRALGGDPKEAMEELRRQRR